MAETGDSSYVGRFITWPQFMAMGAAVIGTPVVIAWILLSQHGALDKHSGAPSNREFSQVIERLANLEASVSEMNTNIALIRQHISASMAIESFESRLHRGIPSDQKAN